MTGYLTDFSRQEASVRWGFTIPGVPAYVSSPPYKNYGEAGGVIPQHVPGLNAHANNYKIPQWDIVLHHLRGAVFNMGVVSCRQALGFSSQDPEFEPKIPIKGHPFYQSSYDGGIDKRLYTSLVSSLRSLNRDRGSRDVTGNKEKVVHHGNYAGLIRPLDRPEDLYFYRPQTPYGVMGISYDEDLMCAVQPAGTSFFKPAPITTLTVAGAPTVPTFTLSTTGYTNQDRFVSARFWIEDLLKKLKERIDAGFSYGPVSQGLNLQSWICEWTISDFRYSPVIPGEPVEFSYTYSFHRYRTGSANPSLAEEKWDISHSIWVDEFTAASNTPSNGSKSIINPPRVSWMYVYKNVYWNRRSSTTDPITHPPAFGGVLMLTDAHVTPRVNFLSKVKPNAGTHLADLSNFESAKQSARTFHLVKTDLEELTPATYYSSSNALEEYLTRIESNLLEFLADAGDLLALLPDLGVLLHAMRDVRRLRPEGILRLGDFIAESYLKYQFGTRPTLETIADLNEHGPQLQKGLNSILDAGGRTIYGKFDYDLHQGPWALRNAHLTTRSKIRLRMTDESFLRTLIALKAGGLAPTLSNMWETLPFSFAVDWFTNLSERYRAIDNQVLFMAFDVAWCVHSLTVYRETLAEDLAPYNFEKLGTFGESTYMRHVSYAMPSLRPSKYDFLEVAPSPSVGVGGSLAWIFTRST